MQPYHNPFDKPLPKVYFYSPPKTKEFLPIKEAQQLSRQKAFSFNSGSNKPNKLSVNDNPFFVHPSFYQKEVSPSKILYKNENATQETERMTIRLKQNSQNQTNTYLFDSKKSNFTNFDHQCKQNKHALLSKLDKEYFKNRFEHFGSLRQTLTNPPSKLQHTQKPLLSRLITQNSKPLSINELNSEQISMKKQKIHNQQNLLTPSQVTNVGPLAVNKPLTTKGNLKQKQNNEGKQVFRSKGQHQVFKSPLNFKSFKQNTQLSLTSNDKFLHPKRQTKFPSFLISKLQKKDDKNHEKPEFRTFKKCLPFNFNLQKRDQSKTPEKKKLVNCRHAKSFSVFETLGNVKKRPQNQPNQSSISGESTQISCQTPRGHRKKSNSIEQHKLKFFQALYSDSRNANKVDHQQNNTKRQLSLRQSLSKQPFPAKSFKKVAIEKQQTKQMSTNIKQVKFKQLQTDEIEQKQLQKDTFKQKSDNQAKQETKCKDLTQKNDKLQTIDDIKQTLINCDLFSQDDYKGIFEAHKKDILKEQLNKKKTQTVRFQIQNSQNKTSLKDLVDSSDGSQSIRSQQEERKLAQLAQMSEQKRSKWILEQTDTIKQSLKQLSEFNTEKSLYENEWKKISMKDFVTSRKNRFSGQFEHIDEVREEQFLFQSKQCKLSSVRLLSETDIDDTFAENQNMNFKKRKLNEVELDVECKKQTVYPISLEDFSIRWCSEQQQTQAGSHQQKEPTFIMYWAQHKQTKTLYTIKKYEKNLLNKLGKSYITDFIKQLKIQIMLHNHPNIEKIYTVFCDELNIYVLCEFTCTKLSEILSKKEQTNLLNPSQQSILLNTLSSEKDRVELFTQIVDGLEQIHLNHIVHKSLQPNSIRIVCDTCKISGFQTASFTEKSFSKVYNQYVCPQTLFDNSKTAMDIWCLGIMAYEILIGKKPFHSDNDHTSNTVRKILQCNFDIPTEKAQLCQEVLNMALKRNPKDRASIFDIKSIWKHKLVKFHTQLPLEHHISQEFMQVLEA